MDAIPSRSRFESFWGDLLPKIMRLLEHTPVVHSYNHVGLKLIRQLRIIPDEFKDALGEPLFADSPEGTYIASEYQKGKDIQALMPVGLRLLEPVDVIERLQQDLASLSSKLKSKTTPVEWHLQAAKFLLQSFEGRCIPRLKKIKFITLDNGDFTSVLEGEVWFPESDGTSIPTDLGLRLVQPEAIKKNKWRKRLFSAIGVTEASVLKVRRLIFEKYKNKDSRATITLSQSVAHLRYLYHTHQISKPDPAIRLFATKSTDSITGSGLGKWKDDCKDQ